MESNYFKAVLCYHDMYAKSYWNDNKGLFVTCVETVAENIEGEIQEASIVVNKEDGKIIVTVKLF